MEGEDPSSELCYFVRYTVHHEDMHNEAFTYTRQTLAYSPPQFLNSDVHHQIPNGEEPLSGDVLVPGTTFTLGANNVDQPFVFDNEKWAHSVAVRPFSIALAVVTQTEFMAFVEEDGYHRRRILVFGRLGVAGVGRCCSSCLLEEKRKWSLVASSFRPMVFSGTASAGYSC